MLHLAIGCVAVLSCQHPLFVLCMPPDRCFNPAACLGGSAAGNATNTSVFAYKSSQCSQPYEGNLCGSCKPGFGHVRAFLCRRCMSRAAIVVLYVLTALAMVGLVKVLVHFSTASSTKQRPSLHVPLPEELLKILVLHGQWIFIISRLVGIPWPATLLYPMQVITGIWSSASGSSLGLDCALSQNHTMPVAVQKVLLCLFLPVAVLCSVLMLEGVLRFFRRRNATRNATAPAHIEIFSMIVIVVFLFLPIWLNTAFSLFTCVTLDQSAAWPFAAEAVGSFWVESMGQPCWKGYHKAWAFGLGIPLAILLCLVLPGGVLLFMWHSRKHNKLGQTVFKRHWGFMYRQWRDEVCGWEAAVVLQTVSLSMVATFGFALGPYFQALVTAAVLFVVVMLLLSVKPFQCRAVNKAAVQSATVLFITVYASLTFLPYNNVEAGSVYSNIVGVVIMLLHLVFLSRMVWKLGCLVDWPGVWQAVSQVATKVCGPLFSKQGGQCGSCLRGFA